MQIIDDKTVVVTTSNDLKEALSLDNGYLYIYFGNDINLESGFLINANKEKVIIDSFYVSCYICTCRMCVFRQESRI